MNKQKLILSFVLILACSLTAAASDVYKRVNEDGLIEFSDRPSPDADKIEVKPNVVETNPVTRPTPATSSADKKATGASASSSRQGNANNENVRTKSQRERSAREQNREENNLELEADHDPGRANRNAARAVAGPR